MPPEGDGTGTRRAALLVWIAAIVSVAYAAPLEPKQAQELLSRLMSADPARRSTARAGLTASGDRSLIPHLVDALFFAPVEAKPDIVACLEELSGAHLGSRYRYWVEYVGGHEGDHPKQGYRAWKAALYSKIDPAFARFLDPLQPLLIRPEEIVWGGVRKDGIPALKNPKTIPASDARFLAESETVFAVGFHGEYRAYPQRILDWHEMVNDSVGGTPFAISYCTLCGSAVAYATRRPDGSTLVFGSSGLLYRSNKLMYDEGTLSLWSNLTGEPIGGPLAGRGIALPILPVTVTSWKEWKARHPESTVASLETGYDRDYSVGAAYGKYFASPETMFPVWKRSDALEAKEWVYALRVGAAAKAYPLAVLFRERVVNDRVGSSTVVLFADPNSGAVRAYARGEHLYAEGPTPDTLVEPATGVVWKVREESLTPASGPPVHLGRQPGHRAYWFGWYAFFPDTALYEGCEK
ncbi:MAG TPA: DUF3179 domain-containing protein [Thermoanaerobaculia bacterium]|jgi:hypothetical protein